MNRIRLHFDDKFLSLNYKKCWISFPDNYKYISDLIHEISMRYLYLNQEENDSDETKTNDEEREEGNKVRIESHGIYLTLNQYCLPPNEVKEIIKDWKIEYFGVIFFISLSSRLICLSYFVFFCACF